MLDMDQPLTKQSVDELIEVFETELDTLKAECGGITPEMRERLRLLEAFERVRDYLEGRIVA